MRCKETTIAVVQSKDVAYKSKSCDHTCTRVQILYIVNKVKDCIIKLSRHLAQGSVTTDNMYIDK